MNFLPNWMQSEWLHALGWTFIHSLWQIAVIGLLLYIALRLIPGRSAHLRYTISTLGLWGMVVMALATFILMLPETKQVTEVTGTLILLQGTSTLNFTDKLSIWLESNMPMMLTIWMGGVMILMLRLCFSLVWVGHLRSTSALTSDLQSTLNAIVHRLRITIHPIVAESVHVTSPVTIGHLKPLILFPVGIINQLTPTEVEAILTHELAHIVRRDYLSNLVQSFIETLFYYHPVAWWMSRVVRTERENRADDLAISWCGDHLGYAKALMAVQEMQVEHIPALAIGFSSRKGAMLARIQRILHIPYKNHNQMEKTVLLSLCSLCFLAFTFTGNANKEQGNKNENPLSELVSIIDNTPDTIPSKGTYRIHKKTDDQEINIEVENGDIIELEIDGKEIEPGDFEDYDQVISELFGEVDAPPSMEGFNFEMHPMPAMPAMPYMEGMPALPPMPPMPGMPSHELLELERFYGNGGNILLRNGENMKVITDSTGNGMARIIIIQDGDSSVITCPSGAYGYSFDADAPRIAMEELRMNSAEWEEHAKQWKEQSKEWEKQWKDNEKQWQENAEKWKEEWRANEDQYRELEHYKMDAEQMEHLRQSLRETEGADGITEEALEELRNSLRETEGLHGQLDEELARGHVYALRSPRMNMQDAMVEEGIIEPGEEALIQLTPDKLKINGKKMDDDTHRRYLEMYEAQQGVELTGNSRVEFRVKTRRSM